MIRSILPMNALWRFQNQARYLVSLVDAVDELLGWWVPQEVHGGGIHSLCLHVLGGCSGHCSHMDSEGSSTNDRWPHGGEETKEKPQSGLKSNQGADGREVSVSQANLFVTMKENWSTSVGELLPEGRGKSSAKPCPIPQIRDGQHTNSFSIVSSIISIATSDQQG